jgi:fructan beta-fructosidase
MIYKSFFTVLGLCFSLSLLAQDTTGFKELYRPQLHFSPKAHWINDPNGMFYFNQTYHLFYQHYPGASVWGPMHWGHATSKDLIHWKELPIVLYPDSLGYIFSGSAVVDSNNTSGFGKAGQIPLVAIFTHHDPKGEKEGKNNYQNQSLAYSLDEGATWVKYSGNPVLKNPGIRDFRDPKVRWFAKERKWIMTLATLDRVTFYSSSNLKDWTKESEFGLGVGGHGGVWECPDLFPLELQGKAYWVLLLSINPGGPNKGSATQYFIGDFDGRIFKPVDIETRWIDYGPDNYAGVTWSNTGKRNIFLGWMSNWLYANQTPTESWRNAMTIPRDLRLAEVNGKVLLASYPVDELKSLIANTQVFKDLAIANVNLNATLRKLPEQSLIKLSGNANADLRLVFSNPSGETLIVGYDKKTNTYFIDRKNSGKVNFQKDFAGRFTAPRVGNSKNIDLTIVMDNTSIELFADGGLSNLTALFFPNKPLTQMQIKATKGTKLKQFLLSGLKSIWH